MVKEVSLEKNSRSSPMEDSVRPNPTHLSSRPLRTRSSSLFAAIICTLVQLSSQAKIVHFAVRNNHTLADNIERTMALSSLSTVNGTGDATNHVAFGTFLINRDATGIIGTVNLSTLDYGDLGIFSNPSNRTVSNVVVYDDTFGGAIFQKQQAVALFTYNPAGTQIVSYKFSATGTISDGLSYIGTNLFRVDTARYVYQVREGLGSVSQVFYFLTGVSLRMITYGASITVTSVGYRDSTDSNSIFIYGTECAALGSTNGVCMVWGQISTDFISTTYNARTYFRDVNAMSPTKYGNLVGNFIPLSCVMEDSTNYAYCIWYTSTAKYIGAYDLTNVKNISPVAAGAATTAITTELDVSGSGSVLSIQGRLTRVSSNGSQVILIEDGTPSVKYHICIMTEKSNFCNPDISDKSIQIIFPTTNPGSINLPLFTIREETFNGGSRIRAYYESVKSEIIHAANVIICDHPTEFYLGPRDAYICSSGSASALPDGTPQSVYPGYRANVLTYAYEACAIENCDVCNTDINVCQVCASGYRHQDIDGNGTMRCILCTNPRCATCAINGNNTCMSCYPHYGNLTYLANTFDNNAACSGCDGDWWDGPNPTTLNSCEHRICSENCILDGCSRSHICDTCIATWMHGPNSWYCTECESNENGFGYYYHAETTSCLPVCKNFACVDCMTPGGCNECKTGFTGVDCDSCGYGYVWASTGTNEYGPADIYDECVIRCDKSVVFGCSQCNTADHCSICKTGWYQSDPLSDNAACDKCDEEEGYYFINGDCQKNCTINYCETCSADGNSCTKCLEGYTGSTCNSCAQNWTSFSSLEVSFSCIKDCKAILRGLNPLVDNCYGFDEMCKCNQCDGAYRDPDNYCYSCKAGYEFDLDDMCIPSCNVPECSSCASPDVCASNGCNNNKLTSDWCQSCATNYIWVDDACHLTCTNVYAAGCTNGLKGCTSYVNVCDNCNTGYTGTLCNSCATGYYDSTLGSVNLNCMPNCDDSGINSECSACSTTPYGTCTSCVDSIDKEPKTGAGEYGCKYKCNIDTTHCTSNCVYAANICAECATGWIGDSCNTCSSDYSRDPTDPTCPPKCDSNCETGQCSVFGQCDAGKCTADYNWVAEIFGSTSGTCVFKCPVHCSVSCSTADVCPVGMCQTGWGPDTVCDSCVIGYHHPDGDTNSCVIDCSSHCIGGCFNPNVCSGSCQIGWSPEGSCIECAPGYHTPEGAFDICVPNCDITYCNYCDIPNICSSCDGFITGAQCNTCQMGYENYPECTPICVQHCRNNKCIMPYHCELCEEGYAGWACSYCDRGYKRSNDGTCIKCSIPGCAYCSSPDVCETCFQSFLTQDKSRCLPLRDVCKPNLAGCAVCLNNSFCSQCAPGLELYNNGTECVGVNIFCRINNCNSCNKQDQCEFCAAGYQPSDDRSECVFDCTIEHCASCAENGTCLECDIGFYRNADNTTCLEAENVLPQLDEQIFIRDESSAVVEFTNSALNFNISAFKYQFVNEVTDEIMDCAAAECSATYIADRDKALEFIFKTSFSMAKGYCIVTYSMNDVQLATKIDTRMLQTANSTAGTGSIKIKNVVLKGDGKADVSARDAFIAINTIRFFATIILGVCNTAHAFWSTNLFSWLQLWALLRGPFLAYPDRFLTWHYKWYLLAINFGDPFKKWDDWSQNGIVCKASEEYPLSRMGCSISDTFGQNLIVIVCILSFCFVMSVILYLTSKAVKTANGRRWITRLQSGLALTYFMRFMMAIMPSLIYFSILQFYTHKSTAHMALGVVVAFTFLLFYSVMTALTYMLSKKIWDAIQKTNTTDLSMELVANRHGGLLSGLSFQFNDLKNITAFWQLQYPVVEFFRVFFVSIFMITLGEDAGTSLGFVLAFEVLRFGFQLALFAKKTSIYYAIVDAFAGIWFVLYIVLKLVTTDGSMSELNRQEKLGMAMAVFVCFQWGIMLIDIVYDAVVGLKRLFSAESAGEERARKYEDTSNQVDGGKPNGLEVAYYPASQPQKQLS